MSRTAVVVVGGGPVGLTTALGLAQRGIDVTVLEAAETVGTAPRAIAYLYPVLDGFERLDLLDDLTRIGVRSAGLTFIDHATGELLPQRIDALDGLVRHPYTLQLGQDQITRCLLDRLAEQPTAQVALGVAVTGIEQQDAGLLVHTSGPDGDQAWECAWLVGADGARSTVRRSLGLEFVGFTWPDRFIATNLRYDFEAHGYGDANWRIDEQFGAIVGKITADGLWRFTYREAGDLPVESLEERVHEHLAAALPGRGSYELVAHSSYRMHQRVVDSMRVGRVLLAGDAAHVTNPTGGLGLTGGFLDAFVLAEALAAVVDGAAPDAVLDRYAELRRRTFVDVVSPMAVRNKGMVFDPPSGPARRALIDRLRASSHDPSLRRADLLGLADVVTPSLVEPGGARAPRPPAIA